VAPHGDKIGQELLFVVGRLADPGADDQPGRGLDADLRVVAMLEAVFGFHDTALLVGEVDLILGAGLRLGGLRHGAAGLFVVLRALRARLARPDNGP
jgi:hypothetical protein